MRFLPMFAKRFVWGIVGDYVNGVVMIEDIMAEAKEKNVSPLDLFRTKFNF